ncbi:flavodoxin [Bacillus phage CAM003]|uniref:Flavodoxin n=1 Tax=Bacillus phage CAM003 TaxID=1486657 RepID=A0A024B064_9CAUD|nr:flavodoxin [Bacillus phage CAM003]AHZ09571.1 flavodoxin [Bacillus phage CAM003]
MTSTYKSAALFVYSRKGNTIGILNNLDETDVTYIHRWTKDLTPEEVQKSFDNSEVILLGLPTYYPTYQTEPEFPKYLKDFEETILTLKGKSIILFGSGRSEYALFCGVLDYMYEKLSYQNTVHMFKFEGYPKQEQIDSFELLVRYVLEGR